MRFLLHGWYPARAALIFEIYERNEPLQFQTLVPGSQHTMHGPTSQRDSYSTCASYPFVAPLCTGIPIPMQFHSFLTQE